MILLEWAALIGISLTAAFVTSTWMRQGGATPALISGLISPGRRRDRVYLFDGTALVATNDRRFRPDAAGAADWDGLRNALIAAFPGFPASPDQVRASGSLEVPGTRAADGARACLEWIDGLVRVQIDAHGSGSSADTPGRHPAVLPEMAIDQAPYPAWFLDDANRVGWTNAAYRELVGKVRPDTQDIADPVFRPEACIGGTGRKSRVAIEPDPDGRKLWFDVKVRPQDDGKLCYATDINAVVDAEIAQRNFVQTLAKTFAQLSIGLAIFDRNRQLALFNPALIDLTSLPVDFLSSRPGVLSFFDRLRNRNMMPEPKNYGGWRQQMNHLIEAAADGRYQETWTLPSGSVYSVSGRPHPDGAVAFLFEDITAEITLTRRFRAELELGQSVLDSLSDAVVVFASDGTLAMSNRAYNGLWRVDPDKNFAQVSIVDATRIWQDRCAATPVWGEIRDFVATRENRAEWWSRIELRTGAAMTCIVTPIQNGATLVRFADWSGAETTRELTRVNG